MPQLANLERFGKQKTSKRMVKNRKVTHKNILITGGCGHIGSSLIRSAPPHYGITVVDNMWTQRYCSLFNHEKRIRFIEKDINDITQEDLKDIHTVIHLASITNATNSFHHKDQVESVNYEATVNLMNTCKEVGCKFIFPSSTSIYGVATEEVYEDNDSYLNPQSPYAESKIKGEVCLKDSGLEYLILRFGTIFGISDGMRFHTAINKFCYQASIREPLTVWRENFNQYRPYLGLNDCVNSIIHLAESDNWNQTYNVLTKNYKLSEIISIIEDHIDIEINMVDTPLLNQYSYLVNDDKIRNTNFTPKDDIECEIKKTLNRLRNLN